MFTCICIAPLIVMVVFSISHTLTDEDTALLKPLCKTLCLPFQPPVEVTVLKKVLRDDPDTGRKIEYKALPTPNTPSTSCSAFVSLNSVADFGQIKSFFVYRSTTFAVVQKFQHFIPQSDGLMLVSDMTSTKKVILTLDTLSYPLVVAHDHIDRELWILNYLL